MKKVRRSLLLFLLYSKRQYKRISFWMLLCAVLLLAMGVRKLSAGENGILHILLCQENPSDTLSGKIVERLLTEESVIQYTLVQQPEEARTLVETGGADAAWIFPDEMQKRLDQFIGGGFGEDGMIRVVEREDNAALRLAREKLFGALYTYASYSLYRNFIYKDIELETGEETLLECYEDTAVEGSLFQFSFASGSSEASDITKQNFLVTPVRGMLALLVLLCELTATMYFLQDQEKGVLDAVPWHKRRKYLYLQQITVTGAVAAAVLAALYLSGIFTQWSCEIVWMAAYISMCMGFCGLLQRFCRSMRNLAASVPVLMLLSFVLCPVFFSVRKLRVLSYLLPPFYYLNTIHNKSYLYGMIIYCVLAFALDLIWGRIADRRNIFLSGS